jgi:tRNA pseudouridine55 synthase
MAIPKGLEPTGIILVDKPAGPSSFAIVAEVRRRTKAKTGHAGTLDPLATGLLVLLSGRATRLASCFVGLDKRYLTEIDLSARTATGDPEGEVLERHEPLKGPALEAALEGLRGDIELPIPAASAVKIGGERAYRLHRQGIAVDMPLRRSRVDVLDVIAEDEGFLTLDLQVSSGTYVRSIADALGGHCVSLRRTAVGPFRVEEADPGRVVPVEAALARIGLTPEQVEAVRRGGGGHGGQGGRQGAPSGQGVPSGQGGQSGHAGRGGEGDPVAPVSPGGTPPGGTPPGRRSSGRALP